MNRIIAIAGMKRAGKDTIADYLQQHHGYQNKKVAHTLKEVVKLAFTMNDEQVEGDLKDVVDKRWGITPRLAMQFIGTEVMQYKIQEILPDIGRLFWIKQLCEHINQLDKSVRVSISDVRFVHEVEELRRQFGNQLYVIKVTRPMQSHNIIDEHPSEIEWKQIHEDCLIENEGDLADLHKKVALAIAHLI